jgi:alpha-L-arabinofuranosidase
LKLVNATSVDRPITITLEGIGTAARTVRVNTLHGNTIWATNTTRDPKRIVPVSSTLPIKGEAIPYSVPAYSIQVLEIELK